MKKIIILLTLFGLLASIFFLVNTTYAYLDPYGGAPPPSYGGVDPGDVDAPEWNTIFGIRVTSYDQWIGEVWKWALILVVPTATLVLTAAGVLYMTSEGDSSKMALAKKLVIGVVSGISILILARLILMITLGTEGLNNWGLTGW